MCPYCLSDDYVVIDVIGSGEWPPYLHVDECGSVNLLACTKCGLVRLSKGTLERIEDEKKRREKLKRKWREERERTTESEEV